MTLSMSLPVGDAVSRFVARMRSRRAFGFDPLDDGAQVGD
jgi:hypothetical protein